MVLSRWGSGCDLMGIILAGLGKMGFFMMNIYIHIYLLLLLLKLFSTNRQCFIVATNHLLYCV